MQQPGVFIIFKYLCMKGKRTRMTLYSKIRLSGRYGKYTYIISSLLTLAMSALVIFQPIAIPICVIFKMFSIPAVLYLYMTFSRKPEMYFYINLGISRNEYYMIPFAVEFIAFILMMIITGKIGYAIQ